MSQLADVELFSQIPQQYLQDLDQIAKTYGFTFDQVKAQFAIIHQEFIPQVEDLNERCQKVIQVTRIRASNAAKKRDDKKGTKATHQDEKVLKELTSEQIQELKNEFSDLRLVMPLQDDHFVNVVCDWLSGLTDGYREYMVMGAFWLISSFCHYNVEIRLKQETIRPNIWVTFFGKSTRARKSTIIHKISSIHESVTGVHLPNEDFSLEGYLESLAANPKQQHVRDEVASFLAKIHKQYNEGFSETECAVYDGQSFRKILSSKGAKAPKTFEVENPYVTKLYATVGDNYFKYMTIEDYLSGRELRNMFVFPMYNKPSMALDVESNEDVQKWIIVLERAKKIHKFINSQEKISFKLDKEALGFFSRISSEMEESADKTDNSMLQSAVGRSSMHILKLAMLIELGKPEISTTITKESIAIATHAVLNYFIPTLLDIIDRLQEDIKNNMIERVTAVLRRSGGALQHTKALHASKLKSKEFAECIATLIESETIECVREIKTQKDFYILKDMKTKLDMGIFENPSNPQNLQNHPVTNDNIGQEILETLKNIVLFDRAGISKSYKDTHAGMNKQSKYNLSLQNHQDNSTIGEPEISGILVTQGTQDVFEENSDPAYASW